MKKCARCRITFREGTTAIGERLQCSDCSLPFISVWGNHKATYNMVPPGFEWRTLMTPLLHKWDAPLTPEELA